MQYLKADSELGYIDDYTEIELEKLQNLRDSIKCFTFGDYDETGNYIIEDEVVDDLIAMEKYVVEADGNMEFCKSSLKLDKQINFIISYEENRIYLLLIEKIKDKVNPDIEEFNEYILDEYVVNGLVDRNIIYAKWNVKPFGGYVLDIFSCEDEVLEKYFGIVSRFKYLLQSNESLLDEEEDLEEVEAEYFNEMIEVLKRYPKLYEIVIMKMSKFMDENEELFDESKPWYLSHVNQLLNYCIKSNIGVLAGVEKVEFEIEQHQLHVGGNMKKAALIPTDKRENGTLILKTSNNEKKISEISETYLGVVKKVNKILNKEKDGAEAKKTFTKKEIALIKLEKAGIKKLKENVKPKQTLVGNIVKAAKEANKSGGKTAGKSGGGASKDKAKAKAKAGSKVKAAASSKGSSAGKGDKKAGGGNAKPVKKAKTDDKKKAADAKKKAAAKKKAEEEKKKKAELMRRRYTASTASAVYAQAKMVQRVGLNLASQHSTLTSQAHNSGASGYNVGGVAPPTGSGNPDNQNRNNSNPTAFIKRRNSQYEDRAFSGDRRQDFSNSQGNQTHAKDNFLAGQNAPIENNFLTKHNAETNNEHVLP